MTAAIHRPFAAAMWVLGSIAGFSALAVSGREIGAALDTFEVFLEIGDPTLNAWLLDPAACGQVEFAGLIADIRQFNSLS